MTDTFGQLAPNIAKSFVNAWNAHSRALEIAPLPYIDHLLQAFISAQRMYPMQVCEELRLAVPNMTLGTAKRLVLLKFGERAERDEPLLTRSAI